MKAVQVKEQGLDAAALTVSTIPKPKAGKGEILVRNVLTGLNFIDTYFRTGLYKKPTPFTLGSEGVGFVEEVGSDVDPAHFGCKTVADLLKLRVGYLAGPMETYAEYTSTPFSTAFTVPADISNEDVIAMTLQGRTAHYLTHSVYPLKKGTWCLVHAAAGGTGQVVVQMAKLLGATVIGTCSEGKIPLAKGFGCDYVIDYHKQDVAKEVKALTEGKGVQVVYDGVGKTTYESSFNSVARRGTVCLFGNASGPVPPIDPLLLSAKGSIFLTRASLFDYVSDPKESLKRVEDIFGYLRNKQVKFTIDKIFTLEEAGKAHEYIESGKSVGKILIKIN